MIGDDLFLCKFGLFLLTILTIILCLIFVFNSVTKIKLDLTGIATIVLAMVTGFLAYDAHQQVSVMAGQLEEMQVSRRPWVTMVARPGDGGIDYDINGVSISLHLVLRNTGTSSRNWHAC